METALNHPSIIADDRERGSGVVTALQSITGVPVTMQRLRTGDYLADSRLLFERKTLQDFAASIVDERLFRQAARLTQSRYKGILILEGTGKDLVQTGVTREAMQGALITISLVFGIPVIRSLHPEETARLILCAARQIRTAAQGAIQRHGYRPRGRKARQQFILQGLPGVGCKRAEKLLSFFGSIEGVIKAPAEELEAVDGIGRQTADKIRWIVSEKTAAYRSTADDRLFDF